CRVLVSMHQVIKEIIFLYFFFQAEDGIRVFHVTGVQTCALPILLGIVRHGLMSLASVTTVAICLTVLAAILLVAVNLQHMAVERSEERRVGKEWRARWSTGH